MDSKIREITEKIFQEGVEKGNQKADEIITGAQEKRDTLLRDAQQEADRIVQEATKKAEEIRKNTEAELKLYTAQTIEALKATIADTLTGSIVESNIKAAAADADTMKSFLAKIIGNWTPGEALVIETQEAQALQAYFEAHAKHLLDRGITIKEVNNTPTEFTIRPQDGSYKIVFGQETLVDFFKSFLRPQLIQKLFD